MARVTEEQILGALGRVTDSDAGADVVSLGMISGLVIKDGMVGFALEVDPAKGERKEPLRLACEQIVEALPGVLSVTVVLTAHREAAQASPAPAPQAQATDKPLIPGIRSIVAVASGKAASANRPPRSTWRWHWR